ncbi:MAG: ThuA domain-containing protein [Spongiibacteraceae bacterium]
MSSYNKSAGRIDCLLITGGVWHDIDFARLELLKLLAEDDRIRVRVFEDYENLEALAKADFIISYTCNVVPSLQAQEALKLWVEQGGRWYALHGTNSIIRLMSDGLYGTPDWAPLFVETLGSMFRSHPPIAPYTVSVADPSHPLVEGIESFESTDELYLMKTYGDLHVLLDTEFSGTAEGFVESEWEHARHPVFYTHTVGEGQVLYLTLGHCRHHYDMQPLMDYWPSVDRGAWDLPVFYTLLRRGIQWAIEPFDKTSQQEKQKAVDNQ